MTVSAVALDFDGVVCDSRRECLIVAFAAYSGDARSADETPWERRSIESASAERFLTYRYLVGPAHGYWALCRLVADSAPDSSFEAEGFSAYLEAHAPEAAAFESRFFHVRNMLRARSRSWWLALHRPYPQFEAIRKALDCPTVYIVTTKDSASVQEILAAWDAPIPKRRILGRESHATKRDALQEILATTGAPCSELAFVDDHLPHLCSCLDLGVQCYFAKWGFTPGQPALDPRIVAIDSLEGILRGVHVD